MIDILDLFNKPRHLQFTKEEKKIIREHLKKESYVVKYALYNKHSKKGSNIAFIIDSKNNARRRSAAENNWNYISERELTDIEFEEIISNYGCNNRRFIVWYYKNIENLILDDLKYNIETPIEFVKSCRNKGYTLKKNNHSIKK